MHVTDEDEAAIKFSLGLSRPARPMVLEQEIEVIKKTQGLIIDKFPSKKGIPEYQEREISNLLDHGEGLCYDRARAIAKSLSWQGFEVRHVFVIFTRIPGSQKVLSPVEAVFTRGTGSHALVKVKTSAGWLVVGTNTKWISLSTKTGLPVDIKDIRSASNSFIASPDWINEPFVSIEGLYSRRGQFYPPYTPLPELNWYDFVTSLF